MSLESKYLRADLLIFTGLLAVKFVMSLSLEINFLDSVSASYASVELSKKNPMYRYRDGCNQEEPFRQKRELTPFVKFVCAQGFSK
jgi:hypothetical protein